MITEEDPKYLDLLQRAAKVRHYLAAHPGSTYDQIKTALAIKCPIQWLLNHGYIYRKPNPEPGQFAPVYYPLPLGTPFYAEIPEDEDETLAAAPETLRERDSDEV